MKVKDKDNASESSEQDYIEPHHPEFADLRPAALDPDRNPDGTYKKGHSGCWKPGESGNPNGRPPKDSKPPKPPTPRTISACMKHMLDKQCTVKGYKQLTWKEALAKKVLKFAIAEGKSGLVKEILDRTEGTVAQLHEVEATSKTVLTFKVAEPPPDFLKNRMNGKLNGLTGKGIEN